MTLSVVARKDGKNQQKINVQSEAPKSRVRVAPSAPPPASYPRNPFPFFFHDPIHIVAILLL